MSTKKRIRACLFDLDGVIVDTARFHFIAWRRLANELGFDFTEEDNEKLKGVSRMGSLDLILLWGGVALNQKEKEHWAAIKNEWYLEMVRNMTPADILDGVLPFLADVKEHDCKVVLGSSSKNARTILRQVDLEDAFEAVIDGTVTTRTKPDPQVFQMGAEAVGVDPVQAIVFEDAAKGIEAALRGGFYAVGIGQSEVLGEAHLVLPNFIGRTFTEIERSLPLRSLT